MCWLQKWCLSSPIPATHTTHWCKLWPLCEGKRLPAAAADTAVFVCVFLPWELEGIFFFFRLFSPAQIPGCRVRREEKNATDCQPWALIKLTLATLKPARGNAAQARQGWLGTSWRREGEGSEEVNATQSSYINMLWAIRKLWKGSGLSSANEPIGKSSCEMNPCDSAVPGISSLASLVCLRVLEARPAKLCLSSAHSTPPMKTILNSLQEYPGDLGQDSHPCSITWYPTSPWSTLVTALSSSLCTLARGWSWKPFCFSFAMETQAGSEEAVFKYGETFSTKKAFLK